jgi:hypothetical protein
MHFNIYANCRRIYLVGSPAVDRRTPEQQGHRSCRGGVRCRGEGERANAEERERMGGRKEGKKKKKKGRRVGGGAGQLAFQN